MQFRGPHFRCTTANYDSSLKIDYSSSSKQSLQAPIFTTAWDREGLIYSSRQYDITNYTVRRNLSGELVWHVNCVVKEQICTAQSVLYSVTVAFPRGIQTVDHSFSDAQKLSRKVIGCGEEPRFRLDLPPETQAFKDWYQELSTVVPVSNEWAVLDALGALIEGTAFRVESVPNRLLPLPGYPSLEAPLRPVSSPYLSDCQQMNGSSILTPVYDCGLWMGHNDYETPNGESSSLTVRQCED